jgi:hypothetical protein
MENQIYFKVLQRLIFEAKQLEEFSGVGAVGGFTGPLGADPPDVGEPILKATIKRKKSGRKR